MANPQPDDAHLRIAHSINEQLMVSHFSEQQRRMLDFILRLSWGCNNKVAHIPHQRDFEIVGVLEGHVKAHLNWLVEARVIIRQDCYYQFNKDFDQWRVSRAAGYTNEKLTEIISLNLNHNKPELTESVSPPEKLTESVSSGLQQNLRKRETIAYGKRKIDESPPSPIPPTPSPPTPPLKKVLKKSIYIPYPEFPNVDKMSKEENQKLIEKFGEDGAKDRVENLSLYIASKGDKYKSHYATILNWDKRDKKEREKGGTHRKSARTLPKIYTDPRTIF